MNQKLPRVEHLKERAKDCCCSYCGGDLAVRRILYQTTAEYRIELYCDNCEKIEYGVPRALYDSAKAAIERLTREMKEAAKLLEFEHAAFLRDQIDRLRRGENPTVDSAAETERKQNHSQTQRKGRKYLGKR